MRLSREETRPAWHLPLPWICFYSKFIRGSLTLNVKFLKSCHEKYIIDMQLLYEILFVRSECCKNIKCAKYTHPILDIHRSRWWGPVTCDKVSRVQPWSRCEFMTCALAPPVWSRRQICFHIAAWDNCSLFLSNFTLPFTNIVTNIWKKTWC